MVRDVLDGGDGDDRVGMLAPIPTAARDDLQTDQLGAHLQHVTAATAAATTAALREILLLLLLLLMLLVVVKALRDDGALNHAEPLSVNLRRSPQQKR